MDLQKARIKIASADIDKVNQTCEYIKSISEKTGVPIKGPIPLPTKKLKIQPEEVLLGKVKHHGKDMRCESIKGLLI